MIYLGTLGRMIGIKCPSSQSVEHEERYSFQTTLEGRRKAQARPRGPRTWSLQTSDATTPEQAATLMQFAHGAWGPGPFVFVSAEAPATNMLLPAVSLCDPAENYESGVVPGGPMLQPTGEWAARSYMRSTPGLFLFGRTRTPLPNSGSVSASVTVLGAGSVARISWYRLGPDGPNVLLGHSRSDDTGVGFEPRRLKVSATPPPGAVGCVVGVENAIQVSAPALVWGADVPAWSEGQGCAGAVVHAASRNLVLAVPGATYSNVGFTITEVG